VCHSVETELKVTAELFSLGDRASEDLSEALPCLAFIDFVVIHTAWRLLSSKLRW
jgi:hypothetical protein